jgi:uncharacterized protein YbjT (DUF2867 family)
VADTFPLPLTTGGFGQPAVEQPPATGGERIAFVDARDIAAVAGHALTGDGHAGAAYTLSGPAALTLAELTQRLGAVTGRVVRALDPAPEEVVAGLEPWLTEVLSDVYDRGRAGRFGEVTDDVRAVTGRSARSVDAFIAEHAAAWRHAA